MVKKLHGTGQLPDKEGQNDKTDDLYLIPTAEVSCYKLVS
jgi:seryl-tRNA synthetase